MKRPSGVDKFQKGCEPKGKTEPFTQPVVLRFPPSAYRVVQPHELEQWQQEVKEQLGLVFGVGEAAVGTVTYCDHRGSRATYRSDADIESGSDPTVENERERPSRLQRWDAKPFVLHFPPAAYEVVGADELREWVDGLEGILGIDIDHDAGYIHTWTYCRGPQGEGYPCDCDST